MRRHLGGQHVFGQDQYHWARATIHRRCEGAGDVLRDAPCVVNAFYPLGHAAGAGAKKAEVIDLLKRLPIAGVTGHITHKQHHRCGILKRRVHADRRIGGPRSARHKTHAWPPGQPAVRLGHVGRSAFLAVDDELDFVGMPMKSVEHGKITFTGHTESMRHALGDKAFDQQVPADFGRGIQRV